jgi:hypothetical protein
MEYHQLFLILGQVPQHHLHLQDTQRLEICNTYRPQHHHQNGNLFQETSQHFSSLHIPAIEGPPSYETIMDTTCLLNANAASIHSELGGGNYGHLALTISVASYTNSAPLPAWHPPTLAPPQ